MTVQQFEQDRYLLENDEGTTYLIDLAEFEGNGWCGCDNFKYKHQPILERGCLLPVRRCKHIELIRGML